MADPQEHPAEPRAAESDPAPLGAEGVRARGRGWGAQRRPLPRHHHERHDVRAGDRQRVTFIASIDTTPPSIGGSKGVRADVSSKALNLSAWITNGGISLKTSSGNIATGCQDVGGGVTVPKKGEDYNFTSLTACARKRLKNARADFKDETQVTITANPGVDYKTVIGVMDALRADGEEELFPEVHFGVAR